MNTYKALLKHDKGTVTIKVTATDESTARKMVCQAENCPPSAILKVWDPMFRRKDGKLTIYAFACGYLESYSGAFPCDIERDSACWHVKRSTSDPDWDLKPRLWESFDTIKEARAFAKRYARKGPENSL